MAKILDLNGLQQIEINGIPWQNHLNLMARWHEELSKSMNHDDYLCIETKTGWIEFHFNK